MSENGDHSKQKAPLKVSEPYFDPLLKQKLVIGVLIVVLWAIGLPLFVLWFADAPLINDAIQDIKSALK